MERALHDSLCAIKRTLESGSVVPGGGACETALSIYLENFATTLVCFPSCFCCLLPKTHMIGHLLGLEGATCDR